MDPTEHTHAQRETGAQPPTGEDLVNLGHRLESYRRIRMGRSQKQVADLTRERDGKGITEQTISRIERGNRQHDGRHSRPDIHTLVLLSEVYRLTEPERDEILRMAGYNPAHVPQLPRGDMWDLPTEELHRLAGRIDAILDHRRRLEQE